MNVPCSASIPFAALAILCFAGGCSSPSPSPGGTSTTDGGAADAGSTPSDAGATTVDAATGDRKRVFVTSATYHGNIGAPPSGYPAATEACTSLATAAGLRGDWVPWLYTDEGGTAVSPATKLGNGPWYLVDRTTLVFADGAALASGAPPAHGIDTDENGRPVADTESVWTGAPMKPGGPKTCGSWTTTNDTGTATNVGKTTDWQGGEIAIMCAQEYHLYCFER